MTALMSECCVWLRPSVQVQVVTNKWLYLCSTNIQLLGGNRWLRVRRCPQCIKQHFLTTDFADLCPFNRLTRRLYITAAVWARMSSYSSFDYSASSSSGSSSSRRSSFDASTSSFFLSDGEIDEDRVFLNFEVAVTRLPAVSGEASV